MLFGALHMTRMQLACYVTKTIDDTIFIGMCCCNNYFLIHFDTTDLKLAIMLQPECSNGFHKVIFKEILLVTWL